MRRKSASRNPDEAPAITARRAAMDMLARREHSFHELLQKLTEKYPDFSRDDVIIPALTRLREENLQSDTRFVEAFVRYRSSRGNGPLKISAELYPRKIAEDLLKSALYSQGIDWYTLCVDVLQKKFNTDLAPSPKEQQQWQRFLQQRGFEHEQIKTAMTQVKRSAKSYRNSGDEDY